ncbi:MAG TPA: methyltransferase domain-containing protein [Polyangia bacterium]|jgi:Predicted SAM-dependent methyltransferases|nr:methyltransferase domain-containing protein [Polyangia bacterium]
MRQASVREPAIPSVVVNARGRARIASGHPWVYRQDVLSGPATDARQGGPTLVAVLDERQRTLASATWATLSPVALRVLQRRSESAPLPELMPLVSERLQAALVWRQRLALDRDALRLVHGEADGLPGLFVDRYADAAVMQTTSVAMDAARPALATLLHKLLGVRVVVVRDDGSARDFEGLPRVREIAAGEGATEVVYRLGENRLQADLLTDSKTGGFLDQADNHAVVAALAPPGARCLDAFTYHGGFALALARRQGPVLASDEDAQAVARAQANAARNHLPNLEVRQANAFELLRTLEADKQRFDVVVLDPPALAKRQAGDHAALRAYQELMLRGLRLTKPGGLTVSCSCSGRVSRAQFDELVSAAAAQSGRSTQILERRGAGRDHPELAGVPETGHLKCWILRVL